MLKSLLLILLFQSCILQAQTYTSYFTGDTADVKPQTQFGLCLMGGATEEDHAIRWLLQRSGGGDVIVLRTTGTNGYNNYLYSQLGVSVNSVETILFKNRTAANDPYVLRQIANAEAIFIAGGDQYTYKQYWDGTPVDSLINYLSAVKKIPIGGTSAGMAILGWAYNSAQTGSVTSAQALSNPYSSLITIENNNFLKLPFMRNTITDTHYDNPDRRGRHVVFLSRLFASYGDSVKGIACDEYTAVCIDSTGIAKVYGGAPAYDDNAYFLQVNPALPNGPEILQSGTPLTWDRNHAALKVYRIKGDTSGNKTFDIKKWQQGTGGEWQHWYVLNGILYTTPGTPPGGSLPIGFEYFSAIKEKNDVQLMWKAVNYEDINTIEIERASDMRSFSKIGKIELITGGSTFKWKDVSPLNGDNFYRIKIIDKSGLADYSSIRLVSIKALTGTMIVSPNPVNQGVIHLKLNHQPVGVYQINLANTEGKIVFKGNFLHNYSENHDLMIPKSLTRGTYQLIITAPEGKISARFIFVR